MDLFPLSIVLSGLFRLAKRLCPLLFGRFNVLLDLRSDRRDLLSSVFGALCIGFAHGFGLPFDFFVAP
jgi:hypothetical protein